MTSLQIISDPICPWCYIGKTRLERALEQVPDHPFDIRWSPFQLNPEMPSAGMGRREYLEAKFGGKDAAVSFYADIEKTAKAEGLDIDFAAIERTPNTLDAHRLIHWAGVEGCQTPLVFRLFQMFFRQGKDISDHDVLIAAAKSAGMDPDMVTRLLATDADADLTRAADQHNREIGVQSVPTFIIDHKYVVVGARETPFWVDLINEINTISRGPDA